MELSSRIDPVLSVARRVCPRCRRFAEVPRSKPWTRSGRPGLLGLTLPEEVGGLGGGPQELVQVVSALASACGSTAMVYLMHVAAAMTVAAGPPGGLAGHAALVGRRSRAGNPGVLRDGFAVALLGTGVPGPTQRSTSSGVDAARAGSPLPATPTSTSPPPATPTPRAASMCSPSRQERPVSPSPVRSTASDCAATRPVR